MKPIARFDFGNDFVNTDEGFIKCERLYQSPRYLWLDELRNRWFDPALPAPYRDIVYAPDGEFRMGLPAGAYELRLVFFDPTESWPTFRVSAGGGDAHAKGHAETASAIVSVPRGERTEVTLRVQHGGGALSVGFHGGANGFFVSGMDVYGPEGAAFERLYDEAPRDAVPDAATLRAGDAPDPRAALERLCDWLLAARTEDGFLGDFEEGKRLWYTASYPLRTLLAASELLGRDDCRDAAFVLLDRFVSEQMPEGAFTQSYRGVATADCTPDMLERARQTNWMNLADVGSMVAALATACRYASGERAERYKQAVRHYLFDWAMRFERDGGFTNGWVGRMDEKVYSVSTASTALTLALFHALGGEGDTLSIAERAADVLASHWHEDGRLWNHIYDTTYPGHDHHQETCEFGDGFYTLETISALLAHARDEALRAKLFEALRRYLFGAKGILGLLGDKAWWPLQNNWHNSKSAGNPVLLMDFLRYGAAFGASQAEIERARAALDGCMRFLCDAECARSIGVMASDAARAMPFAAHSIQGWSGCAVAATGFAGLSLAQAVRFGIIYLR